MEQPPLTDAALMALAAGGDRAAFAALYDRYAPVLLATAARMVGAKDAPDLLHDVFLEAWRRARTYQPARGSVRTWLLLRLRSRALDRMGQAARAQLQPIDDWDDPHLNRSPGAGAQSDAAERFAVRQALNELTTDTRQALELTYFDGLTAAEIAQRCGVPIGTVKSRLARGLRALETVLKGTRGGDDGGG